MILTLLGVCLRCGPLCCYAFGFLCCLIGSFALFLENGCICIEAESLMSWFVLILCAIVMGRRCT